MCKADGGDIPGRFCISVVSVVCAHVSSRSHLLIRVVPRVPASPLFVTWEKEGRSGHRQLRGCIGTLSPKSLSSLKDYVYSR